MNFTEITKALKEVSSISSTNEKQVWLKNHDDKDFKNLLSWYFDGSYPTGIAEKKFDKITDSYINQSDDHTFEDVINYLKVNNTGKDTDIIHIRAVMNELCKTEEETECFKKLVCKSYAMGINTPTINKVFPGLIPTFDVALCAKLQDCPKLLDGNTEYEITDKVDGCVSGDTMVITEKGEITIEEVVNNPKKYKNVLSYNEETQKSEFKEIEQYQCKKDTKKKWYKITFSDGRTLKITDNDRLYIPALKTYRMVSDLSVGDEVLIFDKN